MVILPDHLHSIGRIQEVDADYSSRWCETKKAVSRQIGTATNVRNERMAWQRRFWEHAIRDEVDWRRNVDYIHYNLVKHGLARGYGLRSIMPCAEGSMSQRWVITSLRTLSGWIANEVWVCFAKWWMRVAYPPYWATDWRMSWMNCRR